MIAKHHPKDPIAIVGMACRFPGAPDLAAFWQLLESGTNAVIQGEPGSGVGRIGKLAVGPDPKPACCFGGYLDEVDLFDAAFFRLSPVEAQFLDPQQRLMLETCWYALEDAGIAPETLRGSRTGVYTGVSSGQYYDLVRDAIDVETADPASSLYAATGNAPNTASGRVSFALGLQGPAVSIDTACSSSLVAIHQAVSGLLRGESDIALAGGVNMVLSGMSMELRANAGMLSPDGRCATFDEAANGYVRGEGCGIVVLKRLAEAETDRDRIWGVIRSTALNQDGASSGLTVPNGISQERVIKAALKRAGLDPSQIDYLETHGTGTSVGDPIELQAIGNVYGSERAADQPLLIGSVKTNIGHLETAAGVAGVIKVILSMNKRCIPEHLHFSKPNSALAWEELPIQVTAEKNDWPNNSGKPPYAGVSGFGWSGTNAHIILQGYDGPGLKAEHADLGENVVGLPKRIPVALPRSIAQYPSEQLALPRRKLRMLPLSGKSDGALVDAAKQYRSWLNKNNGQPNSDTAQSLLSNMAWTASTGRSHFSHRAGLLYDDLARLREQLDALIAAGKGSDPYRPEKIGFLFTGQGSQWIGMGRDIYETEPVARAVLDRCNEVVQSERNTSLLDVIFGRSSEDLYNTIWAQPAIYAIECAIAELWISLGVRPQMVMGHSVGEFAAAHIAGVISLEDGLQIMMRRSEILSSLPEAGAMAAIFAPVSDVKSAVHEQNGKSQSERLGIAATNGAHQVISGSVKAVQRVAKQFESRNVRVSFLRTDQAFHSPLVAPRLDALEKLFEEIEIATPSIQFISNVTGQAANPDMILDGSYWRRHAREAVAFSRGVQTFATLGVDLVIEVGPHAVLGPMLSLAWPEPGKSQPNNAAPPRVLSSLRRPPEDSADSADQSEYGFIASVANAYEAGVNLSFEGLFAGETRNRISLPGYPFQREHHWVDAPKRRKRDAGHPLLGERHESASGEIFFETELFPSDPTWLQDHKVFDQILAPGALYGALAVAASHSENGGGVVQDLQFHTPMIFSGKSSDEGIDHDTGRKVQTVVRPSEKSLQLQILSKDAEDAEWTVHAECNVLIGPNASQAPQTISLDQLRNAMSPGDIAAFYRDKANVGIGFGPSFHTVQAIWIGEGEALGEIVLPEKNTLSNVSIHPLLLDGCFQVMSAARQTIPEQEKITYLPFGCDRLWFPAQLPNRVVCHVQMNEAAEEANESSGTPAEIMSAELRVYDTHGVLLGGLNGYIVKRATREALLSAVDDIEDLLYEISWRENPLISTVLPADFFPSARTVASNSGLLSDYLAEEGVPVQERTALLDDLERWASSRALQTLDELGWQREHGEVVEPEVLRERLGVLSDHSRVFRQMLKILAKSGILEEIKDSFVVRIASGEILPDELPMELDAFADKMAARYSHGATEIGLFRRCGPALGAVLRGQENPLMLLFSSGDPTPGDLYTKAPVARAANRIMKETVRSLMSGLPADRRLRIIEVGAGTGSATAVILPELPEGRFDYVYTDISVGFFAEAEKRFQDAAASIEYVPLNIENDPATQGFELHSFDLLIASNVLHATRYLDETLGYCLDLLAPSGQLIALENLRGWGWMDLTFGQLDGWWRFADSYRTDHVMASPAVWRRALGDAGFGEVEVLGIEEPDLTGRQEKGVIIAQAPTVIQERAGVWILVGDQNGVAQDLAEDLFLRHQTVMLVEAGEAYPKAPAPELNEPGVIRVTADIHRRESWETLLQGMPKDLTLKGIAHLVALDGESSNVSAEELAQNTQRIVESALALVQAVIDTNVVPAKGIWFITRGAQVIEREFTGQLAGAALWGFGKGVVRELAHLQTRMIDLDPGECAPAPDLVAELLNPDRENHIAYRSGRRSAARVVRENVGSERLSFSDNSAWVLTPDPHGLIENLDVRTLPDRDLEPNEVRVAVKACGMNYWDVFRSLGFIQEDDLGREMCGDVLEVGADVSRVSVGDYIVGLGFGAFASEIVTHEELVAPAPAGFSVSELATMPCAFVSAALSYELSGLEAGDRVLIHAGSGGVGLAAIQLARAAGGEVFTTASAPKQGYLRSLGVKHVFNSRETRFGEEILEATNGEGVDLVLNSLTSEGFIDASLSCLAKGGRFVELARRDILSEEEMAAVRPDVSYAILELDRLKKTDPAQVGKVLRNLVRRFDSGDLNPLIHSRWPIAETGDALRFMRSARHLGKIVLTKSALAQGSFRRDRSYLITGGLGGIGCAVANWLADHGANVIVLNGRRPPGKEAQRVIDALQARDITVHVALADVTDPVAMDKMLADIRQELPPLAGVIHSVGVLSDGELGGQSWKRFQKVLWPKMIGAWHLHRATANCDLDMFLLFSSRVGVMGNPGQANHAAANAFLDQLAAHRRAVGLPGQTIAWGAWSEIGEAAEQKERIEERLAALGSRWFTPQQGIKALDELVRTDGTNPVVMSMDWGVYQEAIQDRPAFLEDLLDDASDEESDSTVLLEDPLSLLRGMPAAEHKDLLVSFLQQELQAVLRLPNAPSPTVGFFDLGMDSLMAVELRNRLNRAFADEYVASNTVVFDYPDINTLAGHLADELGSIGPAPAPLQLVAQQQQPVAQSDEDGIAVIGMACRFPGAPDIEAFWGLLESGRNTVSDGRTDPGPWEGVMGNPSAEDPVLRRGSFLDGLDQFDAEFFKIRPVEARIMDPRQRILLETSWNAIEDAAIDPDSLRSSRTGIYVGMGPSEYRELLSGSGQDYNYLGTAASVAIGRIAFLLGLMGPAVALDMTCASSLAAIHQAILGLRSGEINLALAGGVNVVLSPATTRFMADYDLLSLSGNCRTFDAEADGFVRGEGCGIVILKRLSDAVSDGDRIWGIIRGSAVNQNGASAALTVPNGKAQEQVLEDALSQSGISPSEVDFLEVHATGSPMGDPIEVNSAASVYGRDREADHPLLLGTVKTNIGHLESAAGVAGLIKVLLAMDRRVLPKHLHFDEPNPYVEWSQLPIQVTSENVDWPSRTGRPPRAGVSAFSISGANAHIVVEGHTQSRDATCNSPAGAPKSIPVPELRVDVDISDTENWDQRRVRILPLSSKSDNALRELAGRHIHWLDEHSTMQYAGISVEDLLADMTWTAATGRSHLSLRTGIVFDDEKSLRSGLMSVAGTNGRLPVPEKSPKLAFLFSAKETLEVGVGAELYRTEPVVRAVLDHCDQLLQEELGASLLDVMLGNSENLSDLTIWRVPALFALQCAQAALWESVGIHPDAVIGVGPGEIAAAYAAGVLKLEDGLALALRHAELVEANPRTEDTQTFLNEMSFALPSTRIVSGMTGLQVSADMPIDAAYWARQARSPATLDKCLSTITEMEITVVVEVGHEMSVNPEAPSPWPKSSEHADTKQVEPGPAGSGKDIANVSSENFMRSVARLYEAGLNLDFSGLFAGEKRSRISLPTYPFQRRHFWFKNSAPSS